MQEKENIAQTLIFSVFSAHFVRYCRGENVRDDIKRINRGNPHVGYAANVVETVSSQGSVITDYQYEQNIYSDSRFLSDYLKRQELQEKTVRIVADGAYSGQEHRDLAAEKNIEIINTALKGMSVPNIYADYELSDDGESVLRCPAGYAPENCTFVSATLKIRARFSHDKCNNNRK